jgi:hypothetical protein
VRFHSVYDGSSDPYRAIFRVGCGFAVAREPRRK